MRRLGSGRVLAAAAGIWAAVAVVSVMAGADLSGVSPEIRKEVLWNLRLPRVLLAALVGAALSTAGAVFQGLFRNPLADPFVIGVSGGAALAAVLSIVLGASATVLGLAPVAAAAFVGGLLAAGVVYRLARVRGRVPLPTLLLAGFAVGALASAFLSVLLVAASRSWSEIVLWLMGSLAHTDAWSRLRIMGPAVVLAMGLAAIYARDLNMFLLGEESARHLGVEVERAKRMLLVAGAVATAAAVAVGGIIGFVGLVVPNLARALVGPDHRDVLPVSAAAGAVLVSLADLGARCAAPPLELPIGAITALAGAPFFLWVLRRKARS
ncbi:MAG: iron chelate uptake ABC transporter family permease subunit [Planctomycetes bacterium]|nr:iron chelate uptake ABC transporter family permease subunit [Planctomycetota bacterium]